jgi:hypothetical protein
MDRQAVNKKARTKRDRSRPKRITMCTFSPARDLSNSMRLLIRFNDYE